jgi:hypothetical protein
MRSIRGLTRAVQRALLGLFIARAIAHAHGGELNVGSGNDETAFLVLPRRFSSPVATAGAGHA